MSAIPFHYSSFSDRLKSHASTSVFTWSVYGVVQECPLYVLERKSRLEDAPHVYVSAGIHGDEPAGTMALLRMLQQRLFSPKVSWTIFPCLNPTGMIAAKRESFQGMDLNRDFGKAESTETSHHISWLENHGILDFDYSIFMHEDWESKGAYLYSLDDDHRLGREILSSWKESIPVESALEIDGHTAEDGLIADKDSLAEWEGRDDLPEAVYFKQQWDRKSLTIETPSTAYLADRVDAQVLAVQKVADSLL